MQDFNPQQFATNSFLIGLGAAASVMTSVRSPATIVAAPD